LRGRGTTGRTYRFPDRSTQIAVLGHFRLREGDQVVHTGGFRGFGLFLQKQDKGD
jgi:hypothetical protein